MSHHKQFNYCYSRPKYRNPKKPKAVKVYTIINESNHLLIFGVPKINLQNELKNKLKKFGNLSLRCVTETIRDEMHFNKVEIEQFTDVYHGCFTEIQNARRAKKFLDASSFYGGFLHISYAPELETLDEMRAKIELREKDVLSRLDFNKTKEFKNNNQSNKRKTIDDLIDDCVQQNKRNHS